MMRGVRKAVRRRGHRLLARVCGTIVRVDTLDELVALTFDDGPDPESTPQLLDLLARHGARATFFMIGERAAAHPELVSRVASQGHAIANHSWNHPRFVNLSASERRNQVERCEWALAPYGVRMFRAPYGIQSVASHLSLFAAGFPSIGWNVDLDDWMPHDSGWFVQRLLQVNTRGSIVLLHDSLYRARHPEAADRKPLFDALDTALGMLRPRVEFVTVPELLKSGRAVKTAWIRHDDSPRRSAGQATAIPGTSNHSGVR